MRKTILVILFVILIGLVVASAYHIYSNNKDKQEEIKETTRDTLPKKDEPYENKTNIQSNFTNEEDKKEVELKYDQYLVANGYAGASDNVYYTRNKVLYHFIISSEKTIRLAEGVEKIENDLDGLNAYKSKGFKLIEEDDYVNYID